MRKLRLFWTIIKRSGVDKAAIGLVASVLVCAAIVTVAEPAVVTYGDGLWYCWAVISTVGLGDYTAVTAVGRIATMSLSLYAIIVTAILTGVIVDFYNERREAQRNAALTEFLDKLERLPELSEAELVEISRRVREMR